MLGFDRMEATTLKAAFRRESRRGRLQRSDFEAVMRRVMGVSGGAESRGLMDALFSALDSDGNGSLDWSEFYCGLVMLCRGTMEERLEVAFHMFDSNGNGFIEEHELRRLLIRLAGPWSRGKVEDVLAQCMRADWNHDRRLSWGEFKRSALAGGVLEWLEQTRREFESRLQQATGGHGRGYLGGGYGSDCRRGDARGLWQSGGCIAANATGLTDHEQAFLELVQRVIRQVLWLDNNPGHQELVQEVLALCVPSDRDALDSFVPSNSQWGPPYARHYDRGPPYARHSDSYDRGSMGSSVEVLCCLVSLCKGTPEDKLGSLFHLVAELEMEDEPSAASPQNTKKFTAKEVPEAVTQRRFHKLERKWQRRNQTFSDAVWDAAQYEEEGMVPWHIRLSQKEYKQPVKPAISCRCTYPAYPDSVSVALPGEPTLKICQTCQGSIGFKASEVPQSNEVGLLEELERSQQDQRDLRLQVKPVGST